MTELHTTPADRAAASDLERGGSASRPSALGRLIAIPTERFATDYWGEQPLLTRATELPGPFADLFSNAAVDELISTRGLRTPFLRVAKNGSTLPNSAFTRGGGVGALIADQLDEDRLLELFAGGSTIVLQGLHRTWSPLLTFAGDLAGDLGHPVQINAYVTPAQNTGFSDHYDVHDVFVMQIAGSKRWRIREAVLPAPLRSQTWEERRADVELAAQAPPLIEATLNPGDCLYLPRGYLHAATALGEVSTHLTVGVHVWTGHHLSQQLTALAGRRLAEDPAVRASLPLGVDLGDLHDAQLRAVTEQVKGALIAAIESADIADIVGGLAAEHRAGSRPAPVAPVATVVAAGRLTGSESVRLRAHLAATLSDGDGRLVVRSRLGRQVFDAAQAPSIRQLFATGAASVEELGVELARRLLVGGFAVLEGSGLASVGE